VHAGPAEGGATELEHVSAAAGRCRRESPQGSFDQLCDGGVAVGVEVDAVDRRGPGRFAEGGQVGLWPGGGRWEAAGKNIRLAGSARPIVVPDRLAEGRWTNKYRPWRAPVDTGGGLRDRRRQSPCGTGDIGRGHRIAIGEVARSEVDDHDVDR